MSLTSRFTTKRWKRVTPASHEAAIASPNQRTSLKASSLKASGLTGISLENSDPLLSLTNPPFPDGTPWWKRQSPSTLLALVTGAMTVVYLLYELILAGHLGFPLDEGWVNLVYARNFFQHLSFEYNLGEHTAGPTAPFWVVFLAVAVSIFKDPFLSAKLLGAIFLFLTGYYSFRLLRARRIDYFSSLLGGVLVLTLSRLDWAELSGMETPLASALIMAGLWWYVEEDRPWGKYITGAAFALATLCRPESLLLFAALILHALGNFYFFRKRGDIKTRSIDNLFISFAVYIFILIPIGITNYVISGSVFPAFFSASLRQHSVFALLSSGSYSEVFSRVLRFDAILHSISTLLLPDNPLLMVAIVLALYCLLRDSRLRELHATKIFTIGLTILLSFPYLRTLFLGYDEEFGMHGRWVSFLSPVYVVTGIAALQIIMKRYIFRELSEKAIFYTTAIVMALLGATVLLAIIPPTIGLPLATSSFFISTISLLVLLCASTIIAVKHVGFHIATQKHRRFTDDPAKLDVLTYEEKSELQQMEDDLPVHYIKVLQGVLLILLAWPIAMIPISAHVFGTEVRLTNDVNVATARWINGVTSPQDIIASNEVGALGWFTTRKIVDTRGYLNPKPYTSEQVLLQGATYLIDFSGELDSYANDGMRRNRLSPLAYTDSIASTESKVNARVRAYRILQQPQTK